MDLASLSAGPPSVGPTSPSRPPMTRRWLLPLLAVVALTASCDRLRGGAGGGTVIVATAADPDAILPPTRTSVTGRLVAELLFDPLVEIGPELNPFGEAGFVPRLARRWSWSADSLAITFSLDPDARWHDGTPVIARDVVTGLAAIRDPANGSPVAGEVADIDSIVAPDAQSAVVHFAARSAEQLYTASLVYPLPSHLLDTLPAAGLATSAFAQRPVGSGPYRLVERTPKVRLVLAAVEDHYRGRPGPDRIALSVSPDPATGIAKVWAAEADVWDLLPPPDVAAAARYPHVTLVPSAGWDYTFVAFNFRDPRDSTRAHPLLADRAMRRALTAAVDRDGIVRALFDTLARPLRGPFVRAQYTADTTIAALPFDPTAAGRALDSLGWTGRTRDGIRLRAGRPLRLRALVPAPSANRVRAAVLVQEQLRRAGVDLVIDTREAQAFGAARDGGDFDLVFGGWGTTPSVRGLRSTWGSGARPGWGRQNSGRYASATFDSLVAEGLGSTDPAVTRARIREAYRVIADDAAALWLYEPVPVAAVHARFQRPAWRPEAWWRTLPAWRLAPGATPLPRDARPATP